MLKEEKRGKPAPNVSHRELVMQRRTLDLLLSIGGIGLAGLLMVIGLVMTSNANFSDRYVTTQLEQEKITFKAVDTLTAEERLAPCLVTNAGQALATGKQAECYANSLIGLHIRTVANGRTYAELGDAQTGLRAQIANAVKNSDPAAADLTRQLTDLTAQRETVFKGETLRGMLLTSYGFSVLGTKAAQAATVIYLGVALLTLLSLAGLVHAFTTPRTRAFAAPEPFEANPVRRPVARV